MRDRMILGNNVSFSLDSEKTGVNNNVIVCAGSGCGKTVSVMEPRLLNTYDSSLIVTVTKRRLVHQYTQLFKERGYKVLDLNFARPQSSNAAFDPLAYVKSYTDITFLAESIVRANPRKEHSTADPYWDDSSVSLLTSLIALVMSENKKATFDDVLRLFDSMDIDDGGVGITTNIDDRFKRLEETSGDNYAITHWRSFRSLPSRTARCVFANLSTTIDSVFTPEIRKIIRKYSSIDFREIANEKTVLFVSTSAVSTSLHYFVNMFYSQAIKQLFEYGETMPDGRLPIPVSILCDDFATGSRILNFPQYISIFREKGISVTLLVQSESQLDSIYGGTDTVTIINNCDTYVYMGGMDIRTARNISERLDIPLDEVLYMPVGKVVVFRRGQRPVMTDRYNIFADKEYCRVKNEYEKTTETITRLMNNASSNDIHTTAV